MIQIIQIACGSNHVLALSSTHTLYAWGSNEYGQLGLDCLDRLDCALIPTFLHQHPPHLIHCNRLTIYITQIACGANHSVALDNIGRIYAWGSNSHGQLGDPTIISDISDKIIASISCDPHCNHTIAVDDTGTIYAWGEHYADIPTIIHKPDTFYKYAINTGLFLVSIVAAYLLKKLHAMLIKMICVYMSN